MKVGYDQVILEETGRGDFVARVYRENRRRMEWAYGDSLAEAREQLEAEPVVIELDGIEALLGAEESGVMCE